MCAVVLLCVGWNTAAGTGLAWPGRLSPNCHRHRHHRNQATHCSQPATVQTMGTLRGNTAWYSRAHSHRQPGTGPRVQAAAALIPTFPEPDSCCRVPGVRCVTIRVTQSCIMLRPPGHRLVRWPCPVDTGHPPRTPPPPPPRPGPSLVTRGES